MYRTTLTRIAAILFAFLLASCATSGGQTGEVEIRSGVIEQITPVQMTSSQGLGVGAVVGGVVGLGVGSLIGKGSGRDVAMVLGTIGGAYAGHKVQQRYKDPVQGQQIVVRTTTGVLFTVTHPTDPNAHEQAEPAEGDPFILYQNEPNPFVNKTNIGFYLPAAATATLVVYDETGRILYTTKGDFAKGRNAFQIDLAPVVSEGMLYYRLSTPTDNAVRKMVLVKD